jgi:hypothetical protein
MELIFVVSVLGVFFGFFFDCDGVLKKLDFLDGFLVLHI